MRFTNLLTLLAATSALAFNFKRDEMEDQLQKLGQTLDAQGGDIEKLGQALDAQGGDIEKLGQALDPQGDLGNLTENLNIPTSGSSNVSDECSKIMDDINNKCLADSKAVTQGDEDGCKTFNSNECQSVLKQDISSCSNENAIIIETIVGTLKTGCATDEKGVICPFSKKIQDDPRTTFTDEDIQEICKSEACSEKASDAFNYVKKSTERLISIANNNPKINAKGSTENIDKYIKVLNECRPSANAAADDKNSSGTTQIKVGSALLASVALALYLF